MLTSLCLFFISLRILAYCFGATTRESPHLPTIAMTIYRIAREIYYYLFINGHFMKVELLTEHIGAEITDISIDSLMKVR